jgi:hypothetical protein
MIDGDRGSLTLMTAEANNVSLLSMGHSVDTPQKKRGRPITTGTGHLVSVRLQHDLLYALDRFADDQPNVVSRGDTIRDVLEAHLRENGYLAFTTIVGEAR